MRLQISHDLAGLARQSGVALMMRVAGGASAFAMTLFVSRLLLTSEAGTFFLALAIVTLLAALARLGLDQAITRFVAVANDRQDGLYMQSLYRFSMALTALVSLSLAAICFLLAPIVNQWFFQDEMLTPTLRWMSIGLAGFALSWLHSFFFQGRRQVKSFHWFQQLGMTLSFLLIAGIVVLSMGGQVNAQVFAQAFAAACWAMLAMAMLHWHRTRPSPGKHGCPLSIHLLMATALPLLGMVLLQQLALWLPQIVMGAVTGVRDVATLNAAMRTAGLTSMILMGVNSVVFPSFASLYQAQENIRLKALCQQSTLLMLAVATPFIIILLAAPGWVLSFFGDEFRAGATALRILAVGQLVNVATGSVGGLLNMTGNERAAWRCSTISIFVLVVSQAVLVPLFGMEGSALSQTLTLVVLMGSMSFASKRLLGFAPIGALRRWPTTRPSYASGE